MTLHSIITVDRSRPVFQRARRCEFDPLGAVSCDDGRILSPFQIQGLRMMWWGGLPAEQIASSARVTLDELRRMAVAGGWRRQNETPSAK